ncbi:pinensin family lanthipeptide [Roseivirga sp. BDSF3-8]|uniref:pinensin family lanthipeptide n=1 Tax=Roseivirga sp. BDSF3-8 TaxID=3241598 RepID=UPI003531862D
MKKKNKLSLSDLKVASFATSEIKAVKGGETRPEYTCHPEACNGDAPAVIE